MTRAARPPHRRHSIQTRVMILAATGLVASLSLFAWISSTSLGRLERELVRQQRAIAAGIGAHLDDRLTTIFGALQGLANTSRALLDDPSAPALSSNLRDTYLRASYVDAVFVADRSGRVVASDPVAWPRCTGLDVASLIRSQANPGAPIASNLLACPGSPPPGWRLVLLVPVRSWEGSVMAFAGAVLDPGERRFGQLANAAFRPGLGDLTLVDGAGRVIASSLPGQALATAGARGGIVQSLELAPWRVVSREEPGHGGTASVLVTLAWLGPLLLGLGLFFAWGAARSVSRPLQVLTNAAERIAGGDLSAPIPPLGTDEVGRLGDAFERMRRELARSLDEIASANEALEQRVADRTRELARANVQLQEREQVRQQLLRKVISAQEDERKRLARELHDETTQTLTALGMRLELAATGPPEQRIRELDEARVLATRSLDELRRLLHDLRPSVLDDLGLVPAIRWYADGYLAARGVAVRFEVGALPRRLPYELETAVFRAAQEALNNVARHADAEMVFVEIECEHEKLRVDIEDDGRGFDPARVQPVPGDLRGLGLLGMRERVELFGGIVRIDAAPGRGTHVAIEVPSPGGCDE